MKYSLIISNTTTKKAYVYNLEDNEESVLYYKFNISVGNIPDGEYEWILIPNPYWIPVVVNVNNPFKSITYSESVILVTYSDTLTNGVATLVVKEGGVNERIHYIESGLMKVGDYKDEKISYDKQTSYKTYER